MEQVLIHPDVTIYLEARQIYPIETISRDIVIRAYLVRDEYLSNLYNNSSIYISKTLFEYAKKLKNYNITNDQQHNIMINIANAGNNREFYNLLSNRGLALIGW